MNYPDLSSEKIIGLDIETRDDNLLDLGPGYHRANANMEESTILCVGISTAKKKWGFSWNDKTRKWLKDNSHLAVIGANIVYDLGWLENYGGVSFNGPFFDVLTIESLIDGGRSWYSLDKLAGDYLGEKKQNDGLAYYCEMKGWRGDPRKHLYKIYEDEPEMVHQYCAADAMQAVRIYKAQLPRIKELGLDKVHKLESDLIPVLLRFRRNGVKIDTELLSRSHVELGTRIEALEKQAYKTIGKEINLASTDQLAGVFDDLGLKYPLTDKGNPSIDAGTLDNIEHPFTQTVAELRKLRKLQSTYIEGFERFLVGDRVYTDFHAVKNGSRGTVTGRFSASNPALQTIPSRGEGKKIARRLFIPDLSVWEKQDQSQEEYRIFAHYARGKGASTLQKGFRTDPDFDMHTFTRDFVGFSKDSYGRSLAKSLNFGAMYGMGVHKFAASIGKEVPPNWNFKNFDGYNAQKAEMLKKYDSARLYFGYHGRFGCIKETQKAAQKFAESNGYTRTFLRRRRYLSGDECFKALNATVQGTGGDIMKLWLVGCENAGVFDIVKLHLTIHDEIDFSRDKTIEHEQAAQEIQRIGQECISLKVPLKVDRESGPNWGEVE